VNSGFGSANLYRNEISSETAWFDGFAPDASEFGYFNAYGDWVNKAFSGKGEGAAVYGVNGFHLDYADPTDLGKDVSGNGNHLSSFGLTVDNQVTDTPSKNCTTLNPLYVDSAKITPTNGNLTAIGNASNPAANNVAGTHIIRHKAFFAMKPVTLGNGSFYIGLQSADGLTYCYRQDGATVLAGTVSAYGAAFAVGDWVGCGYAPATGDVEFFKLVGGAWVSQGILPAAITAADVLPWVYASHQTRVDVNFGQRAWPAELPEGYSAHNTPSMPCPDILNPDDYVTARIRTGGAGVNDLPFDPITNGAVVISHRLDIASGWRVNDSVTGVVWETNTANAELVEPDGLTFTADGYDIGANAAYQGTRIDYIFRRSPKAGFDIVPISHVNGTSTTVPQKAGGVIGFALYFPRAGGNRRLFHKALGSNAYIRLNNNAGSDPGAISEAGCFQSTANTLTLGANTPTGDGVLLVWRSVPGLSAFEKYVGKNSVNGAFVPFDFSPRLCMFRLMGAADKGLLVIDTDRDQGNPVRAAHVMSNSDAETVTADDGFDMNSNGLKFRAIGSDYSGLGNDHIICAWAEKPGKFARAR
jgi:hypothetical protein